MIEGVLIDLDNTLYDYSLVHTAAWKHTVQFAKKQLHLANFDKLICEARRQVHIDLADTAASHNRLLYFQKALELAGCPSIIAAKTLYDTYWNCFLDKMKLSKGVLKFLQLNQQKKICILTDLTALIQYQKLIRLKIAPYIHEIVTSEEVGAEKPSVRMFNAALNKLKLSPKQVCMIGDNYEKDILGALQAGIKPYWKVTKEVKPVTVPDSVVIFKSFSELVGKI